MTQLAERFVTQDHGALFDFAKPLVHLLIKSSMAPIVVSGSPAGILEAYRADFPWVQVYGITVKHANGKYLTALTANPASGPAKRSLVASLSVQYEVPAALGDSEPDLPMLYSAACKIVVDNPTSVNDATVLNIQSDWDVGKTLPEVRAYLGNCAPTRSAHLPTRNVDS